MLDESQVVDRRGRDHRGLVVKRISRDLTPQISISRVHLPGKRGRLGRLHGVHQTPVLQLPHLDGCAVAVELVSDPAVVLLRAGAPLLPHLVGDALDRTFKTRFTGFVDVLPPWSLSLFLSCCHFNYTQI